MGTERYLVTGCAGFIGSHMLRRLLDEGIETVGADDFSTGKPENIAPFENSFRFIEGDLCNPAVAEAAVAGVDRIIHLATIPSVPRSVDNPLESVHASILATVTLLDAARRAGVKRIVQASSSSVYGNAARESRHEGLAPDPLSPYATAKLTQEHYARSFCRCYGLDTVSIRYFNVFGPGQNPESKYAAVIPKFITMLAKGARPTIFGDGSQSRDFTYVDNVVHGNLLAARYPGKLEGDVFNVACGNRITLNELVDKINAILGTDVRPEYAPPRIGDILHSRADIAKARERLGFSPLVDLDEGLRRTAEYLSAGRLADAAAGQGAPPLPAPRP